MHAFPTIRNKIQVKDDENDLSIGKKLDKSSELERKEAYEKASLEHEKSKDKQDIFLDNNLKDADKIIKEMTNRNSNAGADKTIRNSQQNKPLRSNQRNPSDGNNGNLRFQACILSTTSLCVVHFLMCT